MLLSGIQHLCFDKDGTLIDVHAYWSYTCSIRVLFAEKKWNLSLSEKNTLLDSMGINPITQLIKKEGPVGYFPRNVVIQSFMKYLNSINKKVTFEEISQLFKEVDIFQQNKNDYCIKLLPRVKETLTLLRERDIIMTIYSSDRKENVQKMLQQYELNMFFSEVIGGGCVTQGKPNPEGFLLACQKVNIPPESSAYIGDTAEDILMGQEASAAKAIGILTGLGIQKNLSEKTPFVIHELSEVLS